MVEVKLHDIGEGMTEGEIIHYFVKAGDMVTVDQPLLEVQTDKMVAELPSPASGKVKNIIIDTGDTVEVGTTLLVLETEEGKTAESKGEKLLAELSSEKIEELPTTLNQEDAVAQKTEKRFIIAAPYTRKVARKFGVDINEVTGTGKSGRITVEDVHQFVKKRDEGSSLEERQETSSQVSEEEDELKYHIQRQGAQNEGKETMPFRGRRKQIAKKMTKSLYTIPHVTHFEEADLTELLAYRNDLKEMNMKVSVAAFFIKAIAVALKKFPVFNAKLDEENEVICLEKEYNIGIATDTEEGLIVPVIHHADRLSVRQIHEKLKELTRKAQEGKLTMDDMRGGTFTVSNVGPLGSIGATPIINHPETGLIAFHKTKKMPVVRENDEIVIRSIMTMSMAFDHRVADGATAVAFTNRFKYLIENPKVWPIELA
ncbi:dihydrolipoamide acetyltransferase family protein [Priestia endophytica]|uniref:dihydrolipoamide acetyltransferase family protein n=1 Tax=Priestia endophytica TaxID=135735 RepID=UPI000DCA61AE|nr:dihydrolipoamide acetyltransferase family protein [Priestia endophytica]RAS85685.1 dihydrolipoyllysine acetyltransferase [Priestia endophytica]